MFNSRQLSIKQTPWISLIPAVAFCLVSLLYSNSAVAQSTVGFQVSGGAIASAGATFRLVPELNIDSEEDAAAGAPILLSRRNGPGFHLGAGLLLNELLIYYRLERMGWKSDLVTCGVDENAPDSRTTAVELPDGTIDDLGVDYACQRSGRDKRTVVDRKAWVAHSLGANYQLYAERLNRPKFYATFGGALTLTTNHITERNARARLGVRLTAGGGMDYYFEDNVALNVEARYEFTVYGKDDTFTRNAYRAGEAGNTVLAAVVEPMHTFAFSIGIRVFLRR